MSYLTRVLWVSLPDPTDLPLTTENFEQKRTNFGE